jgi:hypothetical protein
MLGKGTKGNGQGESRVVILSIFSILSLSFLSPRTLAPPLSSRAGVFR